jgi:uncharacterized protein
VRVVFDTNIYISAFVIPGSRAEEAYLSALHQTFELFTSIPILTETATVLQRKFGWEEEQTQELIQTISRIAHVVKPTKRLHVVADEPDNRILECAIQAKTNYLVTGDRHLLTLGHYEDVTIIRLAEFLETLTNL